jgi:hypothetical protein
MGFDSKGLDDYIDVAQRIAEFRSKYPEGSLQPVNPEQPFEIREVAGTDKDGKERRGTFIIYAAAAYRTPGDTRPGIGCAYEVFPGRTPYTAGSELQNAETAAWGRAIVAALAADTRAGIASQQEVRNRQAERGDPAGDAFENATAARPANQGPRQESGRPQVPVTDEEWLGSALGRAVKLAAREECTALWRESAAKVAEGKCTKADAARVQELITARLAELSDTQNQAAQPGPDTEPLPPGDSWAAKIESLADADEAAGALAEIIGLCKAGTMDVTRANQVRGAILVRFPLAATRERAA